MFEGGGNDVAGTKTQNQVPLGLDCSPLIFGMLINIHMFLSILRVQRNTSYSKHTHIHTNTTLLQSLATAFFKIPNDIME